MFPNQLSETGSGESGLIQTLIIVLLIGIALLPIQVPLNLASITVVISLGDVLIASAAPLLLYNLLKDSSVHISWSLVLTFVIVIFLSVAIAAFRIKGYFDPIISISGLIKLIASIYWAVAGYFMLRKDGYRYFYYLSIVSVSVAVISSIVGAYDVFIINSYRTNGLTQGHRVGVNSFSNYLLMNIALLMGINSYIGDSVTKRFCIICGFSTLVLGVLLTGSRSAFGGLVILFGLYYLKRELEGNAKNLKGAGIVILLTAGVYLHLNPLLIRRIGLAVNILLELPSQLQNPEFSPGFGNRLIWWKAALQTFEQRPLLGVGFDQFRTYNGFAGTPHNQYLKLLSETGIMGLGAYLLLNLWLIRLAVSAHRSYFDGPLYLLFYIISTASMGLFLDIENFRQMWLAIGAIIGLHEYIMTNE